MSDDRAVAILGYGRFGRALAELFVEEGLNVRAFDPRVAVPHSIHAATVAHAVADARVVVVAVPVPAMREVITAVEPHVSSADLVLDVGSVKSGPIAVMREVLGVRVPWIGTHPLFGPTSLALGERPLRVVVCPNEMHAAALPRARALFEAIGCEVIEQDAEEHDRAMADTHALAFFVAKGLLDAHAGEGVAFAPPSFQAIARTIEAVRSDAGHLFRAIHLENPYAGVARKRLLDALSNIDEELVRAAGEAGREDAPHSVAEQHTDTLAIPDLGRESPDLRETRDLIDELDQELIELFARRAALALRAGRAKADRGQSVRDVDRERTLLASRRAWAAALGLDPDGVGDVFDAILRFSRSMQRRKSG
jgi:prephenate dehydrogenase